MKSTSNSDEKTHATVNGIQVVEAILEQADLRGAVFPGTDTTVSRRGAIAAYRFCMALMRAGTRAVWLLP